MGRILLLAWAGLITAGAGCDLFVGPPQNVVEPPPLTVAPSPVRRLTAEELNRTLRDLFRVSSLPTVEITEDRGKDFAQEVQHQQVADLYVDQLRAGVIAVTDVAAANQAAWLVRQPAGADDEVAVINETLQLLLPRAFRRAVLDDERQRYVDFFASRRQAGDPFTVSVQLMLQAMLQSPSFIYRLELDGSAANADSRGRVPVGSTEMASRLSYFLWGSMPDDELLQAGINGDLATSEGIQRQVDRLLADRRFVDAMISFHGQWLDFDRINSTNKSAERFPQYNQALSSSMRREADQFISLLVEEDTSLRALLTTRRTRLMPNLGPVYGVDVPGNDAAVDLPVERSGILTQAQFLASHGHGVEGSPILRGVYVLERLVCEAPPVPNPSINLTPPEPVDTGAPQTNRDRYRQHTQDPVCLSCHVAIDGIGFGLEGYDSIGQYRTVDNGLPVDDSGSLAGTRIGGGYAGAVELGQKLADSPVVHECVARHWFRFANGRREQTADRDDIAAATAAFTADDTAIPALLRALVVTDAFRLRRIQ
jgi:hypothetical protein